MAADPQDTLIASQPGARTVVALHSVLRAGREADYDAVHARIPDDLLEAHRKAGIEHDPANERWQAFIGTYVERSATPLPLVWAMRDQDGTMQRRS